MANSAKEVVLHTRSQTIVPCVPVLPSHTSFPSQIILGECAVSLGASTLTMQSLSHSWYVLNYTICCSFSVCCWLFQDVKGHINCVFLEDLYTSLDCQEWLDIQCLDQVMITTWLFCLSSAINNYYCTVLWCCWLGGKKGIRPVKKLSGGMLAWLCVWVKVPICIWPSWWHCHSLSLDPVNPDWFYLPGFTFLVPAHPDSPRQNPRGP